MAYTTYFELGEPLRGTGTQNTKWRLDYTARHGETSQVFLDMAHFEPEFYLQMGKSFNILFNFMFFVFQDNPSRSKLIRPGLAVRVDPVQLLYLPGAFGLWGRISESLKNKQGSGTFPRKDNPQLLCQHINGTPEWPIWIYAPELVRCKPV